MLSMKIRRIAKMNKIEELKSLLRDIRIKDGVDYAILHKYEKTRVMCSKIWEEPIREIAERIELSIFEWHFYN